MRIAFLTNYFPKLSETFIMNQVIGLLERGHDVQVFALEPPDEELTHEAVEAYNLQERTTYFSQPKDYFSGAVTVARLAAKYPHTIPQIPTALRRGREGGVRLSVLYQFKKRTEWDFDVYHAHFGQVGKRWDFLPEEVDAPYIVSFYGHDASKELSADAKSYQQTFSVADAITVLSEDMRDDVTNAGCAREKTVIQPLPVDLEQFTYSPTTYSEGDGVQLLTVARFTEKKGLDDALDAVNGVADEYDVRWTIAGDGPLRDAFEEEVHNRDLEDTIEVLGWVTQERVHELLNQSHLFLLPSKTSEAGDKEGTPTVLLEAQASGVPVLSTRHAGIPEIVVDGETGILVSEDDAVELMEALKRFLDTPGMWVEMGRQGRSFIEETHSKSAVAAKLENLYEGKT